MFQAAHSALEGRRIIKNKLYFLYIFLTLSILLPVFFVFIRNTFAQNGHLIISEIMYNPAGSDTDREWIEIYNPTDKKISISKDLLGLIDEKEEKDESGKLQNTCHKFEDDLEIDSKDFAIIGNKKSAFENDYPDNKALFLDSTLGLGNTEDSIKISFDRCETWETEIEYSSAWGGKDNSLEKIDLSGKDEKDNWQTSYISGGTPGKENSTKPPPKNYSNKIRFNEILPNPKGTDAGSEWIEFFNFGNDTEDLKNWKLEDKNGKMHILDEQNNDSLKIKAGDFLVIDPNNFNISLHNTSDESISLFDPNGEKIDSFAYKSEGVKENVSYNFFEDNWYWSRFLTKNKENKLNNLPQIKTTKDKKIYTDVYAKFSASGKDADGDELKFTWDFGDGHKSYLKETKHKYKEKGEYAVTLKIFDGSQEKIETLSIKVEDYPETKIKIIGLSPNPKGKDLDMEYILLKNKSKKKINLKNWSIATGWNNLYNHPINKDFIIKSGQSKKLTRKYSLFTLNNKQTKIELRYPDGSIAHKIKYSKDKIEEDEIYTKEITGWTWKAPETTKEASPATSSVTSPSLVEDFNTENISSAELLPEITSLPVDIIGKFSATKNQKQEIEMKILGFKDSKNNLGFNWKLASLNKGFVLGSSTIKNNNPKLPPTDASIFNKYFLRINLHLNNFLTRFLR